MNGWQRWIVAVLLTRELRQTNYSTNWRWR